MGIPTTPRSVSDATRFTAQTPHATSKPSSATRKVPASRRIAPGGGMQANFPRETPEQRIARLRAAHLAAKTQQMSTFDRIAERVRPMMDSAHRITVMSLIVFTGLAGVLTVYTAFDMLAYNRKRKNEFFALAKQLESDSLTAARLAYVRGDATEEQTRMVEELQAKAAKEGIKMPPLFQDDGVTPWTLRSSMGAAGEEEKAPPKPKKKQSWKEWALGNLKREEEGDDVGSSEARLGYESLSEEDDAEGVRESDIVRAVEDKQAWMKEKAREAFEKERENQTKGGPLDRVGMEGKKDDGKGEKKGWF